MIFKNFFEFLESEKSEISIPEIQGYYKKGLFRGKAKVFFEAQTKEKEVSCVYSLLGRSIFQKGEKEPEETERMLADLHGYRLISKSDLIKEMEEKLFPLFQEEVQRIKYRFIPKTPEGKEMEKAVRKAVLESSIRNLFSFEGELFSKERADFISFYASFHPKMKVLSDLHLDNYFYQGEVCLFNQMESLIRWCPEAYETMVLGFFERRYLFEQAKKRERFENIKNLPRFFKDASDLLQLKEKNPGRLFLIQIQKKEGGLVKEYVEEDIVERILSYMLARGLKKKNQAISEQMVLDPGKESLLYKNILNLSCGEETVFLNFSGLFCS